MFTGMPDLVAPPTVERFRRWGIVAWSLIGVLILAGAAFWTLGRVRALFPSLFVALIAIYVLNPLVTRLERVGIRRVFAGCLTYLVLIAVVTVAVSLLIPILIDQGQAFARDVPRAVDRLGGFAHGIGTWLEERFGADFDAREWIGSRSDLVSDVVGRVGGFLRGAVEAATLILVGLVLGFYLLVDLPRLRRSALNLVPPDRREEARRIASGIGAAMGGFFRGQLLVALVVGVMSAVGLRLIGLPYWAIVGLIAGFFNVVPLIGPFIGAVPAILIAAALRPPITILWVVVVLTVVQQIDNHFISPNVMRWSVRLHPVTVMISLIAGATLAGFFGMLVAVPMTASMKVILAHYWRTHVPWGEEVFELEERLEERGSGDAPPGPEAEPVRPAVLPGPGATPEPTATTGPLPPSIPE
jgi:predicted PurR-regulated permease PerM